jgi:hypothetical protein
LGSARDRYRVEYSKTDSLRAAREALFADIAQGGFDGEYYRVVAEVRDAADGQVRLKAVSQSNRLEVGTITFALKSGISNIEWHDEDPDAE